MSGLTRLTHTRPSVRGLFSQALFTTQAGVGKVVLIDGEKSFDEVTVSAWLCTPPSHRSSFCAQLGLFDRVL